VDLNQANAHLDDEIRYILANIFSCHETQNFCHKNCIDFSSIEILTSLIWVNMAPLHEKSLDSFLYYFGKYNLFLNIRGH
jgi:hypothetical protein